MRKFLILSLILLAFIIPISLSRADELEDITKKLDEQKQQLADLEKKKEQLAQAITSASYSLAQVSAELEEAEADLAKIRKELSEREKTLKQWETTRNTLIREFYKESRVSPFEVVFSADSFLDSTRQLQYYQDNLSVLKENITALSGEISTFKENKAKAEELRNELGDLRNQYQALLSSRQSAYYSATQEISQITKYVKHLSEKQKQLLAEKMGIIDVSVGDVPPADDPKSSPDWSPPFRPALAAFTFGSYHRVGMSQYGAYGRAKSPNNQSYKTILKAYFNATIKENYSVPSKITVDGKKVPFEDNYMRGISEMPRSWPMEALKAQAVAARTYALDYVRKKGSICSTQACQVYRSDRTDCNPPRNNRWCDAIKATEGVVLVDSSGNPVTAWYSSTSGGYMRNSGDIWTSSTSWTKFVIDTTGGKAANWWEKAYENLAGSPWFYKAWYTGAKYPSPHPWLNKDQMNDIVNSTLLYKQNPNHLKYLTATDWCQKKDPACDANNDGKVTDSDWYTRAEVRSKLSNPVDTIKSVSVSVDKKIGKVTMVRFVVEGGREVSFTGLQFLAVFNVRAPGSIHIRSAYSYPLYDLKLKK